jgi:hypothetical protein
MGLFDWLSDAIGSDNGAGGNMLSESMPGMGNPTSGMGVPQPTMPMPPVQQTGTDAQALANPPMPPGPPLGPDSPQNPTGGPVPMPMARPQEAGPGAPPPPSNRGPLQWTPPPFGSSGAASAPAMAPGGGADVPGAMASYKAAGGTMAPPATAPGNGPAAHGILGRALGLDPNTESRMRGSLAAGLKAAGNSAGKSPFQALTSGAGEALGGGEAADNKTEDKQRKYLDQAIEAMKVGDQRQANLALTQLRQAQTKMTLEGKIGKDSVLNSDAQLYLRAVGATNADGPLKLLRKAYDDAVAGGGANSPAAQAAKKAYDDAYKATLDGHLGRLGLDPKAADKIGKQPGMSQDNPVPKTQMTSQEAFDKLPPGAFFVNPKDGKILQKPMAPVAPGGQQQPAGAPGGTTLPAGQGGVPAPTGSNLPPLPPSAPTNPVATTIPGAGADEGDDEKEAA